MTQMPNEIAPHMQAHSIHIVQAATMRRQINLCQPKQPYDMNQIPSQSFQTENMVAPPLLRMDFFQTANMVTPPLLREESVRLR